MPYVTQRTKKAIKFRTNEETDSATAVVIHGLALNAARVRPAASFIGAGVSVTTLACSTCSVLATTVAPPRAAGAGVASAMSSRGVLANAAALWTRQSGFSR